MTRFTRLILRTKRRGLSLLDVLAVVTIMGIIALIVVPRLAGTSNETRATSCSAVKGMIEVQAGLWLRTKGVAPAANLGNIMADRAYFPDGPVTCHVDGSAYTLNTATMRVDGHTHPEL